LVNDDEYDEDSVSETNKKSLDEILKDTQHSTKLKEISEQNEQNKQSGNMDKQIKARILQGLPYQLQQEIMTANYVNKTPNVLTEYFAHQEKIKKLQQDPNNANSKISHTYYPSHRSRMRDKSKKDRRNLHSSRAPKKRPLRVQIPNDGEKKTPVYLRVASPEVLEKMHFTKGNARNALTLDHIVTKQYRNRGRKSGFFGKKRGKISNNNNNNNNNNNVEHKEVEINTNANANSESNTNEEKKKENSSTPKLNSHSLQINNNNNNPETGEKEDTLHRKDTQQIQQEIQQEEQQEQQQQEEQQQEEQQQEEQQQEEQQQEQQEE